MGQNNLIDITGRLREKGVPIMPDDLITPENVSLELIKKIFLDAYYDAEIEDDEYVCVHDTLKVYLSIHPNNIVIQLTSCFGFKESASEIEKLKAVNEINVNYLLVKATSAENNSLQFKYDMPLIGGITRKSLVLNVKRFAAIPRDAIHEYADDIVT